MEFELKIRNIKVVMCSVAYIHHIKVTVHNIPLLEEPHHWRLHSKGIIFTVGRTYFPSAVLTLATCTMYLLKVKHPLFYQATSCTITYATFLIFACFVCHMFLCCRVGKYSDKHLFQNCLVIVTTCFHFLQLDSSPSESWHTSSVALNLARRKWFRVKASKSSGLSPTWVHDRLNFCKDCAQLKSC